MTAMLRFVSRSNLQISVYVGSCEYLECISSSDQYSPASWDATEGQVYYIAVHNSVYGRGFEDGDFVLAIDSAEEGDVCRDVQDLGSIGTDGVTTWGTTSGAGTLSNLPGCYDYVSSPAAVYSVTASESGTMTAGVSSNSLDARVSVYRGACDGWLECLGEHRWRGAS